MRGVLHTRVFSFFFLILLTLPGLAAGCSQKDETPLWTVLLLDPDQKKNVLIIGDSLTHYSEGFGLGTVLGENYTVVYDSVPGTTFPFWTERIEEALARLDGQSPDYICVPLGTNDGALYAPDSFMENVTGFHNALRLHTSAEVHYYQVPRTKSPGQLDGILANNARLASSPPSGGKVRVIDVDSVFEGAANRDLLYTSLDPIHPTQAGYTLFATTMAGAITGITPESKND